MTVPIVVGIDGSVGGTSALRFALAEAVRRNAPIRLVYALPWPPVAAVRTTGGAVVTRLRRESGVVIDQAVERARRIAPEVPLTSAVTGGSPGNALVDQSAEAQLVVVGAGRPAGLRLGGTAAHVVQHAHCPVVAIPARYQERTGPVLVGVDPYDGGVPAIGYAFEQAALRGTDLVAIRAWRPPAHRRTAGVPDDLAAVRSGQEQLLRATLSRWTARYPEVPVQPRLLPGDPATTLVAASTNAALLVVGGSTPVPGGAPGTGTAPQVLHRARCPVAVVYRHRLAHRELPEPVPQRLAG